MTPTHRGLDTETQNGRAVLLCAAGDVMERPRRLGRALEWLACRAPSYVAWNADYDIQALLRLSRGEGENLARLGLTTRATIDGWRLRYVPGKVLEARRGKALVRVFDLFQFYATTLDNAARKYLPPGTGGKTVLPEEVTCFLHSGRMGDALKTQHRGLVIDYCSRDESLAELLGALLETSFLAIGLEFSSPKSPASMARKFWGSRLAGNAGEADEAFAHLAYHGGRIEVLSRGRLRAMRQWDLHSAYPSAMVDLFAPHACARIEGEPLRDDAVMALVDAHVTVPPVPALVSYPFAVESPRGLVYPWGSFRTVMDLHTWGAVETLRARGIDVKTEVHRLVQWVPVDYVRPFARMGELYDERAKRPEASMAIKLVLNSTYGLLAESVPQWTDAKTPTLDGQKYLGGRWRQRIALRGGGQSYLLASHVTGAIRRRVWEETLDAGPRAYMTDGVLCEGTPSGPVGKELGAWEEERRGPALVVGSGLYATRDGRKWKTKTRGWGKLPELPTLLKKAGARSRLRLTDLRAASIRQLAVDPKARWTELNHLKDTPRTLDLNFDVKRVWTRTLRARDFLAREWKSSAPGVVE